MKQFSPSISVACASIIVATGWLVQPLSGNAIISKEFTSGIVYLQGQNESTRAFFNDSLRKNEIKQLNDYYKWEVTTNATLALSRFAGNTTRSLDDDPYMVMIRKFDKLYNDSGYLVGSAMDTQGLVKPTRRHNWRL